MKRWPICAVIPFFLVLVFPPPAFTETIELVTYYPASSNSGDLHVRSITVGMAYQNETPGDGTALIADTVGIGTNAPAGSLHVVGPDNAADNILFMPGTGGILRVAIGTIDPAVPLTQLLTLSHPSDYSIEMRNTAAGGETWHISNLGTGGPGGPGGLRFYNSTDSLERMRIDNSGNVGIGTTAPETTLHLKSPSHTYLRISAPLAFQSSISLADDTNGQDIVLYRPQNTRDFRIWTVTAPDAVSVTQAGNMGIGTTSPAARLQVSRPGGGGNTEVARFSAPGGGSFITIGTGTTVATGAALVFEGTRVRLGLHERNGITITNTDAVGIGTQTPGFTLHVNGSAGKPGGGAWSNSSDRRLKKNVAPMSGALQKMLALRGVTFEWKDPVSQGNLTGTQMGMIGQEVEKVFPEWVSEDPAGMKVLSIRGFEALTVESIRELKAQNEFQRKEIETLRSEVKELSAHKKGES